MSSESDAASSAIPAGDEDAAERGERGADRPGEHRHPVGAGAVERRERPVVDRGTHRDADPGPVEQEPQADRDRDRDADRDHLVRS